MKTPVLFGTFICFQTMTDDLFWMLSVKMAKLKPFSVKQREREGKKKKRVVTKITFMFPPEEVTMKFKI